MTGSPRKSVGHDDPMEDQPVAQVVTITAVVAPESLTSHQRSIVWIESIAWRIVDDHAPPNLAFSIASEDSSDGQISEPDGSDALPDAVADALKGTPWNPDKDQWRQ